MFSAGIIFAHLELEFFFTMSLFSCEQLPKTTVKQKQDDIILTYIKYIFFQTAKKSLFFVRSMFSIKTGKVWSYFFYFFFKEKALEEEKVGFYARKVLELVKERKT